jgi:hypothetical protein
VSIPEHTKSEIIWLIDQVQSLDLLDAHQVDRWIRASYEALGFNPVHQAKFDEYCCSSWGPGSMRVSLGVWMLKQPLLAQNSALGEDIPEERLIPWEHSCWLRG